MVGDTGPLGYFTTRLDSAEGLNLTSTATTDVFSLPSNISNITIMCDDNGDTLGAESAVLILLGNFLSFYNYSLIPGNSTTTTLLVFL